MSLKMVASVPELLCKIEGLKAEFRAGRTTATPLVAMNLIRSMITQITVMPRTARDLARICAARARSSKTPRPFRRWAFECVFMRSVVGCGERI